MKEADRGAERIIWDAAYLSELLALLWVK